MRSRQHPKFEVSCYSTAYTESAASEETRFISTISGQNHAKVKNRTDCKNLFTRVILRPDSSSTTGTKGFTNKLWMGAPAQVARLLLQRQLFIPVRQSFVFVSRDRTGVRPATFENLLSPFPLCGPSVPSWFWSSLPYCIYLRTRLSGVDGNVSATIKSCKS